MRILLIGSKSFAAGGLDNLLRTQGQHVWTLDRSRNLEAGEYGLEGSVTVTHSWLEQIESVDVIINFALAKGASINDNIAYCENLMGVARRLNASRLIHISSVSVLPPRSKVVTEDSSVDENFTGKGAYAAIKAASEWWLASHAVEEIKLVIVRPGFILGKGMVNPIIGMGRAIPGNRLLCLGRGSVKVPVIDKASVHAVVAGACTMQVTEQTTQLLAVSPNLPSRRDYLGHACAQLGMGSKPLVLPGLFWQVLLLTASCLLSLKAGKWNNLVRKFSMNLSKRTYDSSCTERLLGIDSNCDWKKSLEQAFPQHAQHAPLPLEVASICTEAMVDRIVFLGAGKIVQEEHWLALKQIRYKGEIEWYDPYVREVTSPQGLKLKRIHELETSTATAAIVAAPHFARAQLLQQLPPTVDRIIVEKPWALTSSDSAQFLNSVGDRRVFVMHNYRFKPNLQAALHYARSHNPGNFILGRLHFDSPPVYEAQQTWMRDELSSRILLMDYGVHFLDLCLLPMKSPLLIQNDFVSDPKYGTRWITATFKDKAGKAEVFLRHGFHQRKCQIEWIFENYTIRIGFFPETFQVFHGRYSGVDDAISGLKYFNSTMGKISSKLLGPGRKFTSHAIVLQQFIAIDPSPDLQPIAIDQLNNFYRSIYELGGDVYGTV